MTFANLYNFPLYFQAVRQESASRAGTHLIPFSIALSVSSVGAGYYMRKTGRFWHLTQVSSALMMLMPLSFLLLIGREETTPDWCFYLLVLPTGLGGASVLTTTLVALINSVSRVDIAVATSMSYLFRNTGQILGVSLSGMLLQSVLKQQLRETITGPDAEEIINRIRHETSYIPLLPPETQAEAIQAYANALRYVYGLVLAMSVLMCLSNLLLEPKILPGFESKRRDPAVDADE